MPDILSDPNDTRLRPSLSSTSDLPDITAPAAAAAPDPAPAPDPAAAAAPDPAPAPDPAAAAPAKPEPVAEPSEAAQSRDAALAAANAAKDASETLKKALSILEQRDADNKTAAALREAQLKDKKPARPQRAAFETPEAFDEALDKYTDDVVEWSSRESARLVTAEAEKARVEAQQKTDKETADKKAAEEQTQLAQQWQERQAKFAEEHPDFNEIVMSDEVKISALMSDTILKADNGPAIAYWLGQNRKEAQRIFGLQPAQQLFELGRIASRVEPDTKPQVSRAPKPITPVGARNASGPKDVNEMSTDEYAAHRNAQIRREWDQRHGRA